MARYAEDLHLAMKVLCAKQEKLLRLDDPVDLTKLRVFYVDNFSSPFCVRATSSDIRRAIKNATCHLRNIGASLTEVRIPIPESRTWNLDPRLSVNVILLQLPQEWVSDMFYITTCLFGTVDMPKLLQDPEHPEVIIMYRTCNLIVQ